MELNKQISRHNFRSLLWHAAFLSFASVFIDVDTIMPAMLIEAGGSALQVGFLSAIMLGGSSFTQLFFAPFISNYSFKKGFLLFGINARILALLALAWLLWSAAEGQTLFGVRSIFLLVTIFSVGGAFANISYTDILGKSLLSESRKPFFSFRLVLNGLVFLLAAALVKKVITAADYPLNYAFMILIGFVALLVASLGFWKLLEVTPSRLVIKGFKDFIRLFRFELKENPKLLGFLGFINTQGVSITLLPFVVLFAKERFGTGSGDTGNFLMFKIVGSVITGLLLFLLAGKFRYRYLLSFNALLAASIPMWLLLSPTTPPFSVVFLLGGIVFALYNVSLNGVLLEVSGTSNRALYTGITGAGNILPAVFPLLAGWVVTHLGFEVFFGMYMGVVLSSLYFIRKINCVK